jgi:L-threonylcarbamoyladenylate synthase
VILPGRDAESIAQAADSLRAGALVGLPTETVYGLAADADNEAAVAKIFAAKGRPSNHPLIVHVADANGVAHFADNVPAFANLLIKAFWPGPLTLILPRRAGVAAAAAGGQNSIGLRCPLHPVAHALLMALAADPHPIHGLAAPSANQFGRVSPTTAAHVQSEMGDGLLILDGGACDVGIESTIVDCTRGVPVLLRPGAITPAQMKSVCGQEVLSEDELVDQTETAPRASGTLESHYAPNAKVRLMDAKALQSALDLLGADVDKAGDSKPVIAVYSRVILKSPAHKILRRRMPDDATATAQQLFAVLRDFDAHGVKLIWVETPPDAPDWDGVRDRLTRASVS